MMGLFYSASQINMLSIKSTNAIFQVAKLTQINSELIDTLKKKFPRFYTKNGEDFILYLLYILWVKIKRSCPFFTLRVMSDNSVVIFEDKKELF